VSGFISSRTAKTVVLNTTAESMTLQNDDIVSRQELPQSLMPEGLLEALSPADAKALIAYFMHASQVPLPATP
jgi:hypothetical protein